MCSWFSRLMVTDDRRLVTSSFFFSFFTDNIEVTYILVGFKQTSQLHRKMYDNYISDIRLAWLFQFYPVCLLSYYDCGKLQCF